MVVDNSIRSEAMVVELLLRGVALRLLDQGRLAASGCAWNMEGFD